MITIYIKTSHHRFEFKTNDGIDLRFYPNTTSRWWNSYWYKSISLNPYERVVYEWVDQTFYSL